MWPLWMYFLYFSCLEWRFSQAYTSGERASTPPTNGLARVAEPVVVGANGRVRAGHRKPSRVERRREYKYLLQYAARVS